MKALNLYGINQLIYDDVKDPVMQEDEVIIKVMAAGICGSDIQRVYEKGTYHFPTIIGHEFSGYITEAKDKSDIGKRVAVFPLIPCKNCAACKSGEYAQCNKYDYYGSRRDGGFSEYIAVKRENLIQIPEGVSYEEAAMCEPASVALHALRKGNFSIGKTIAIFGVGTIGLIMAQWARAAGADKVILVARTKEKVMFAQKLGFNFVFNSTECNTIELIEKLTDGYGVDISIEGTGKSEILEECVEATKIFGTIVALGNPLKDMSLSQTAYWNILRKELNIVGTWNSSFNLLKNDWKDSLQAMQSKKLDLIPLITHKFDLQDNMKAFEVIRNKKELVCKVMFINRK